MAAPTAATDNLKEWLQGLGLEKYADAFAREEIELKVIAELTDTDLQSLGIPMGPRKQILRAIDQLKQASTSAAAPPVPRNVDEPERRQLTVMFCDLVGSTALSRRLDPEDMRDLIRAYQDLVVEHVARFDGHIASFAGDGVKVYFGFPTALENQAERAIRAAKSISDAIGSLRTPAQEPLAIRIGVATGPVVVGDLIGKGAAQEELVVGETPNLAARLQTLAEPGETVISATTRQLSCKGPAATSLKASVSRWRPGACSVRARLQAALTHYVRSTRRR
jgi:class 3 adenylate cyclase